MEIVEKFPVVSTFVIFFLGIISALVSSYFTFATKLAFIEGQLNQLLKFNEGLSDIVEKSAKIDLALETIDNVHHRIKSLEQKFLNGRFYERSS